MSVYLLSQRLHRHLVCWKCAGHNHKINAAEVQETPMQHSRRFPDIALQTIGNFLFSVYTIGNFLFSVYSQKEGREAISYGECLQSLKGRVAYNRKVHISRKHAGHPHRVTRCCKEVLHYGFYLLGTMRPHFGQNSNMKQLWKKAHKT